MKQVRFATVMLATLTLLACSTEADNAQVPTGAREPALSPAVEQPMPLWNSVYFDKPRIAGLVVDALRKEGIRVLEVSEKPNSFGFSYNHEDSEKVSEIFKREFGQKPPECDSLGYKMDSLELENARHALREASVPFREMIYEWRVHLVWEPESREKVRGLFELEGMANVYEDVECEQPSNHSLKLDGPDGPPT